MAPPNAQQTDAPLSERVTVVIPARYDSSRFPGKPLAVLGGKSLIHHVCDAAKSANQVEDVIVATDDARIQQAVKDFGGQVILTEAPCRTGTDRVALVADQIDSEVIVNLQADEIIQDGRLLNDLIAPFLQCDAGMGTLKRSIHTVEELHNPGVVKVVTGQAGEALYFSRAPIPLIRDAPPSCPLNESVHSMHLGIYIFRRSTLKQFAKLPTGTLEDHEKLEQLRALEWGIPIRVWDTTHHSFRIDTPEDLEEVRHIWEEAACHE